VLDKMQRRLDANPEAMQVRRRTAEHPFGTIKAWMGAIQVRRYRGVLPKGDTPPLRRADHEDSAIARGEYIGMTPQRDKLSVRLT
jgi:hypothetical protein